MSEIVRKFSRMPEEKRVKFVEDTLEWLIDMAGDPKNLVKAFSFVKKKRLSREDLRIINTIVTAFLYSIKDEFRYQWAELIYTLLQRPIPEDIPKKLRRIRKLRFLHMPLQDHELYQKLKDLAVLYGGWDNLLGACVQAIETAEKKEGGGSGE